MTKTSLEKLAERADAASGEERKRLVERLIKEQRKCDVWEDVSAGVRWLAEFLARSKQLPRQSND